MAMEVGPMAVTDTADMAAVITELDPTTTFTMDTLESTTTVTANTMGTRAMATTSMTMTVATMTIMRMTMVTKIAMDMVTKGTMTTITGMKIPMVLGESTDVTGVTVTITVPLTDLGEATSHSWASIISSIL